VASVEGNRLATVEANSYAAWQALPLKPGLDRYRGTQRLSRRNERVERLIPTYFDEFSVMLVHDDLDKACELGRQSCSGLVSMFVRVPGVAANIGYEERAGFRRSSVGPRRRWTRDVRCGIDVHLRRTPRSAK